MPCQDGSSSVARNVGKQIRVTSTPIDVENVTHSPYDSGDSPLRFKPSSVSTSRASVTYDKSTKPFPPRPETKILSSLNVSNRPTKVAWATPFARRDTCISANTAAHFFTSATPSATSDELMFLSTALLQGINQAVRLAAILGWKYQRPLRALLAAMSERGKNGSRKRKRPSDREP
jgi:hypothetical protein